MTAVEQDKALKHVLAAFFGEEGAALAARHVVYGPPVWASPMHRLAIAPCGFFEEGVYGVPASQPALPLDRIEGTPLLFGQAKIDRIAEPEGRRRLIVHADIVASAYFLLTRYEEVVRRDVRDRHGRFPGRESLPFRAGFLHRPVVDEYAALLRNWLREVGVELPTPPARIEKIHLTHDVDVPWAWAGIRAILGATLQNAVRKPVSWLDPLFSYWGLREGRDPNDCFQWILAQDASLRDSLGARRVESTFFLLAGGGGARGDADYLDDTRTKKLIGKIRSGGASIGLHSSYSAGIHPERISAENARLRQATGCPCRANRHHYLALREPEDANALEAAGLTDDFTMGYADLAGFRLGTCRPVRWFDPVAIRQTRVALHPLTVMDCTLDDERHMNLDYEAARDTCYALLAEVRKHNGEAVLLWHNTVLSEPAAAAGSYHRKLYLDVLEHLKGCA
jgi:hypothetical protein